MALPSIAGTAKSALRHALLASLEFFESVEGQKGRRSVGLKDMVERLAGKRSSAQRGSRGPRERKRDRDEPTIQVQSPIVTGSNPPSPMPPVAPQAPVSPAAVPPSSAASPPVVPPVARPVTPPPAAAPPAPAPSAPQVGSADKTQYVTIPPIDVGQLVGVLVGLAGELERLSSGSLRASHDKDEQADRRESSCR